MEKVYAFKAAFKYREGLWRRIEIEGGQTLADFDGIMREAFNHDTWDHLSEFYPEHARGMNGFGEIEPHGGGTGAEVRIADLGLFEGDKLEYVYDFGDNIQHVITLEEIVGPESGVKYPRISAKSKTRKRYCVECKEMGKKTVATWICIECSEEAGEDICLCDDCLTSEHEDHDAEEIQY